MTAQLLEEQLMEMTVQLQEEQLMEMTAQLLEEQLVEMTMQLLEEQLVEMIVQLLEEQLMEMTVHLLEEQLVWMAGQWRMYKLLQVPRRQMRMQWRSYGLNGWGGGWVQMAGTYSHSLWWGSGAGKMMLSQLKHKQMIGGEAS